MIAALIKTAAELKRKTTTVESHSDHCPHCDFEFREKCYPVVKDKGVCVPRIDKVYQTGEYDEHCPECDGILDQKDQSDEEIEANAWGLDWVRDEAKARRETQRRRKAEREGQEKKAMVKQEGNVWILYTADGERVLGRHTSAKKAYAQEYAIKVKNTDEHDVYISSVFPGKKKYHGTHSGGFAYSNEPGGPVVGEVGSGLSDETRAAMFERPDEFVGRTARVRAAKRMPSGALYSPVFLALHEDIPQR